MGCDAPVMSVKGHAIYRGVRRESSVGARLLNAADVYLRRRNIYIFIRTICTH